MTVGLLERELPAAEIVRPASEDDIDKVLAEAAARADVLAVVGGDGTVNAGARAALTHDVPLLVVPGGTFDHFSRAYGIESPADAIAAYRNGRLGRVDVGSVQSTDEEQLFLNTASFGAYTEIVDRRERLERRLGKWPALAIAAVRTLRRSQPVELDVDGHRRRVWLAFVGNCVYGTPGAAPSWRSRLDDGRLDIRVVATGRRVPRVRAVAAVLAGHLPLMPGYRAWHAGGLELWSPAGGCASPATARCRRWRAPSASPNTAGPSPSSAPPSEPRGVRMAGVRPGRGRERRY
ncbi:diacylglycerol/lipid kinase family protein [Actinomadura sp. CNU-125]|uniref:diacylglycerol/lipid kinase family protein n=1 Tax=Actinomadura sp. CNU-125 TaxID=1904961 RepID=UPI0021CD10FC|nr:diacylglycerol kinase family protein [Actinomadura sp. CNU-125]